MNILQNNQNFSVLLDFLQCGFRSTHHRRIYPTLCAKIFRPQKALKFKERFSEVEPKLLCKALKFTSNLPGDLYSPAECVEYVESFAQKFFKNSILNVVQI